MKKFAVTFLIIAGVFVLAGSVFAANGITNRLKGRLLLQVEDRGRIWYVDPVGMQKHEVTFANALNLFEDLALGISNSDLHKIPISFNAVSDDVDTDGDGFSDYTEVLNGYNHEVTSDPNNRGNDKLHYDYSLGERLKGRLLLQVEDRGRVWYVDMDGKRWEVTWANLMNLFRSLALGITDDDLNNVGINGIETFTDTDLGISFYYPTYLWGKEAKVTVISNTAYVHSSAHPATEGQYVEIFSKNPSDTLQEAIEKQFDLANKTNCWVNNDKIKYNDDGSITSDALYFPAVTGEPPYDLQGYCPEGYGITNGERYFYTEEGSDKFAFFSIGQYDIALPDETPWQDTFKFLNNSDTSGWGTYTNTGLGFSVDYPSSWKEVIDVTEMEDQVYLRLSAYRNPDNKELGTTMQEAFCYGRMTRGEWAIEYDKYLNNERPSMGTELVRDSEHV